MHSVYQYASRQRENVACAPYVWVTALMSSCLRPPSHSLGSAEWLVDGRPVLHEMPHLNHVQGIAGMLMQPVIAQRVVLCYMEAKFIAFEIFIETSCRYTPGQQVPPSVA